MRLELGYFEEFKGHGETILVDGDESGFLALAQLLRGLEASTASPIALHSLPFAVANDGLELTAYPVGEELGVRRPDPSSLHFSWNHSEEGWLEAAEKIEAVAEHGCAHNWLECIGYEDAVVMVSINEYGPAWWS